MKAHKLERPQRTFFFERHDGSIINVNEREAWNIYNNRTQVVGWRYAPPKLVGVSDGLKMYEAVQKAHELYKTNPDGAVELLKKGQEEELETARGNIIAPRDFDMVDRRGLPTNLNQLQ